MKGATVAVQGFGNVGSIAAQLLQAEGCKVVAISDRTGGYVNRKGIDVDHASQKLDLGTLEAEALPTTRVKIG